jgi:Holliday junction resolvase RusA-like endonuclease
VTITFFVPGLPKPAGSKKGFAIPDKKRPGKHRVIITDAAGVPGKAWRADCKGYARDAYDGPPLTGPILAEFVFTLPRPKGHYGTGKNGGKLKASAPIAHTIRPDTSKLIRAAEDSLSGIMWRDDAQIIRQTGVKEYGETPGVKITVKCLEETTNA